MRNGVLNNRRLRYILPLVGAVLTFRFIGSRVRRKKLAEQKNNIFSKLFKKR